MDKKKLKIYLEIMANLLQVIRNKDCKIYKLEMQIRELERLKGKESNHFH
tara:strand:+ start:3008 stop:3157 length:150 start_codon:yes stop_codon:yes gene_type:complete